MAKVNDDIPVWNDAAAAEDVPVWNDSLDDTSKKKVSGKESEESSPLESPSQLPERLIPEGGDPFGIARTTSGTIIKDPVPFVKTPDEKPKVYDPALYSTKASDDLKRKHVTQNTLNKVVRDKFMGNQKLFSLGGNPEAEKAVDDFYAELSKSYTPEQIEATKVANQDLNQVRIPVRTASEKQKDEQKKLQDNGVSRWASTVGAIDEAFLVSAAQTLQSVGQMGMFGVDPEIQYSANPAQGVYKAGKWLEKKIKEMGFTNPKYAEDVLTQAATVLGQVGFYGLGGGVGVGAKAGISTAAKTVESIAAKDMARNAPAAFLAGSVNAASEYNVARERTEDANKLPLAEFVQKHAKGNTPEDVENAKNNFLDLQGKNPHDVAYDTWKRDLVAGALFNIAPVASIEKFDKISGGAIKRALVAGATGGVDGIIQESGMEMWNNATAQDYYEKTRSIGANLIETGEMGFLAQGTISALLAGISKGPSTPRTKRDLAYDAKTKEYLESLQQKLDAEQKEETITVDAQGSLIEVNKPKEKATVPTPTPKADVGNEVVTEQVKDVKKEELKPVQPENTAPRLVVENLTKDSPVSDLPDGIAIDLNGEGGTISHAETGEVIFTNFDGKETIVTGGGDVSPLFMSNIKISEGYFTDKNGKYYVRRNKTGYDVFLIGAEGQLKPVYTNEKGNVERKNAIVRKALGGDPAVVNLEIKQSTLENDLLNPKTPDAAKPVIEQAIEQTQNDIEQAKQIAVDETIDAEMKQIDQDFAEGSIAELQAVIDDPSTSEQTKEAVKQEIKAIEAELPVVEKVEGGGADKDLEGNLQKQWMKPAATSEQAVNRLAEFVEASDYKGREQSAFIDRKGESIEVKLRNDDGKWSWYEPKSKKPFASFDNAKDAIKFIQEQPFWDNGELNKDGRNDAYFAKEKADYIKRELDNGNILEDINDGKISAKDAAKIIESAGLEVPKDIAAQSLKETPKAEVPTPKGNTSNEGGEAKKQSKTEIERKQGFKIVNGERVQRQDRVQAVEGDATTIGFSKKDKQEGVWAVVDNSVTQPSHRSGIENPLHFLPEAQPRNRGGMAVLKNEAKQKADNLNPDELGDSPNAYFGAPVINERGEGVQGNGRIEAVDYYYKNYPDDPKGYREFVRKKAAALGIDVSSIEGMKNPVLVRIVKIDDARAIQLGNYKPSDLEDVVQRGGGAKADAGRMNAEQVDAVADMLIANDDGDMSLKDLIRKSGVKIIAKLQDIGVIRVDAKELYVDDKGLITQDGIDHLYGLFRAMIFKDASTQLETMFVALPSNIQKGVERSIVSILRLPDNKSILHEVQNAIAGLYEFNGFKEANSGRANFSQWASTADAFNPAPNTVYSPLELEIIKRLSNTTTQVAVSKMFNDYSDAVSDKAGNIFDAPVIGKSKSEGIKQVFNIDYDEKQIQDKQRGDQNGQRAAEPPKQPVAEKQDQPIVEENGQRQSPGEEAGDPEVLAESVTQDIESETEAIVEADNIEAVEQKLEDIEAIEDKIYPVKKKTKAEKLAAIDVNKETAKADLKKWLADKLSNKGNEGLDIKKMGGLDHDAIIDIVVDAVAGLIKAGIEVQDAINTVIATLKEGKMLDGFSEDRILDSVNIRLENSGDQVNKTFLTDRVYSSQTETHVKESIAKHGLTRNIIGHIISADIASQIIQDIGIKEAVKRVKNYEIDGGPAAEIIGHQIVDFSNKMERSVTPEEFNKWLEERTSLMVYMDARLLSGGQFASQMANIYETSEFNYTIERQIDEFKAVNKGEITPDQEAKLREIDKKYRAASKLVADLEEQMKQREEQVLVDNIKREIEYQGIIEALEKKAGNKKTSGRSLIKEGLSDLRAALGDRNNPLMMGVPVNNVLSALSKIGRGLIQEGVATVKNVAVKIKEYLDSSGIKGIDVGLYASDIEAKMSAEVAVSSTPDRLKIPYKKIRSIVEGGAEDIDSIVSELKNDYPDATDREIRDAVSGYGRTLDPNMDPVEVKLRKAKEAGRVMSAMEDVSVGKRPKKSGQQREKPTPEQRAARKKLKEYMKSLPIDLKTQENDLKNSLDRKKAAIKNRIEDLDREIKEGRKIDKDGKPNLTDKELTDLQEELRVMTRLHDERFVAENILEATQDAIAANEKRAKDLEDRISKGELVKDKPRSLIDQENKDLVASKEKVRELNDALRQLKEEAGILEEQRLRRAIAANERLIEDYNLRTKHQVVKKKKIRVINKHPVNDLLQKKLDDAILEKLYAKEEYDTMRHKQELKNRGDGQKLLDGSLEAWSLTRILMAGFEASFVFIQGAALTIKGAARYPFIIANRALRAFTKNEKMSFEDPSGVAEALRTAAKNFASEKAGEDWHKMLHKQEYYPELKDSNVEITKVDALQQAKDESYASGWIHHVWNMLGWPVAKPIELLLPRTEANKRWRNVNPMKALGRATDAYLNTLRVREFLRGREMLHKEGKTIKSDPGEFKALGDMVNTLTGRSKLGKLEFAAKGLSAVYFSPKNTYSVLKQTVFAPFWIPFGLHAKGTKWNRASAAQKLAVSNLMTYYTTVAAGVFLMGMARDDEDKPVFSIELDPTSTDFMSWTIGDRHYDPWSGRKQPIVLMARVLTEILTDKGGIKTLDGERKHIGADSKSTYWALIKRYFSNKMHPSATLSTRLADQIRKEKDGEVVYTDEYGNEVMNKEEALSYVTAMYWRSVWEVQQEDPVLAEQFLLATGFLGMPSAGVYGAAEPKVKIPPRRGGNKISAEEAQMNREMAKENREFARENRAERRTRDRDR